jgi:hypothetical protein
MAELSEADVARTGRLIDTLVAQVKHDYPPPRVKRDAHPKMHGCVQAEFHVEKTLPAYLQHGIFRNLDSTYLAWVRYSNAFHIQHDLEFETRGMAVKLLDVGADNLVNDDGQTQDFLFATHDVFFLPNPEHYVEFATAVAVSPTKLFGFFIKQRLFRGLWALLRSGYMIVSNPLAIPYYSQTPYSLGPDQAVKLLASPRLTPALKRSLPGRVQFGLRMIVANLALFLFEFPPAKMLIAFFKFQGNKGSAEDFCDHYLALRDCLRLAMMSFLGEHDAWFDVLVQRTSETNPIIDDATKRWRSKFEKVATIRIPRQVFWPEVGMPSTIKNRTTEMVDLGENMSFNPWHALPEHKPLGPINETRRRVYKAIVETRHQLNCVPMPLPTPAKYNEIKAVVQYGDMSTPPVPASPPPCRSDDPR